MMIKKMLFVFVVCVATSCGGGGGGGTTPGETTPPSKPIEEKPTVPTDPAACEVKFLKTDTLKETAVKSNQARVLCKLSEEQVLYLIEHI